MRTQVLGSMAGAVLLLLAAGACNKNTITPPSISLSDDTVSIPATGGAGSVDYEIAYPTEGSEITLSYDETATWVSDIETSKSSISFNVDMNRTEAARSLTVTVSYPGATNVEFTIEQASGAAYMEHPEWSVSYGGLLTDPAQGVYDVITVSGVSAGDLYYPGYVSKADFDEIDGSDIEAYIERTISNEESMMEIMAMFGAGYTWEDVLFSGSGDLYLESGALEAGVEYYAVIFGMDTDGNSTGYYAMSELFVPDERETASEEYSKWIGTWNAVGSDGVANTIEIKELVPNQTYSVAGWQFNISDGMPPITAQYDEASGALLFVCGDLGLIDTGEYGQGTLGLYGIIDTGEVDEEGNPLQSVVTGDYAPAMAVMADASTATVVGNSLELEGEEGTFDVITMEYVTFLTGDWDGYYLSYATAAPLFPVTMTKAADTGTSSVDNKSMAAKFVSPDNSAKVFNSNAAASGLRQAKAVK
ncbi:MAG TPA: BACON domain-containing protein [Candidatus Cryptobacteroides merdipullorum]|uniref:BACON domain-containing protein n=1 Tax=Candidatus Cryptobacteroides merdipullorum TaxID=2840771 RepID=A0A9D1GLU0_9BACT|nr:BACON domain-containing protein [Candidatus Cryptobacteroides merdipullorum]